jgi:drug/metabolite transporter (DMT)-like permease
MTDRPDRAFALPVSPAAGMALGALGVSTSAVLIGLSGASPGTATLFRCLLVLPLLLSLAHLERRRTDALDRRQVVWAVAAGAFFAGDALWWTQAIGEVGAGLSTVLVNAQVVVVPLLALVVDHERVTPRFLLTLPTMAVGVVLAGGVLEHGVSGQDPVAGTSHALLAAACYSGFLFLLRRGGTQGRAIQSYAVVVAVAALCGAAAGHAWGATTLAPGLTQLAWLALVAVCGQVLGWLLIALSGPDLPAEVGAALLMLTPVGALCLGVVVLGERPSALQLAGCVVVLASTYAAATGKRPGRADAPAPPGLGRTPADRAPELRRAHPAGCPTFRPPRSW